MPLAFVNFVGCVALIILSAGSYVIWPSRWNIWAHLQLGFAVSAYIIPIYGVGEFSRFEPALVALYVEFAALGAVGYVLGLLAGNRGRPMARLPFRFSFERLARANFDRYIARRTAILVLAGIAGLWISFAVMGFIPAFARDPLAAKFFRGVYAAPYQRVEILFRLSEFALATVASILLAVWLARKRPASMLLLIAALLTLALTLSRGQMAVGLVVIAGVAAARRKSWSVLYLAFVLLVFPFGAAVYHLVGLGHSYRSGFWQTIAAGSPDISDQLNFLFHFLPRHQFTYGRTFWGGLIPGHYKWSPGIYSLLVINGESRFTNTAVSGGLRMIAPIWGYTAFGWAGVFLVPFLSGAIQARCIKFTRRMGESKPLLQASVVYVAYTAVLVPLSQFYLLSLYLIPTCFFVALLIYPAFLSRRETLGLREQHGVPGAPTWVQTALPEARYR